jgi:hypothetical protein
MNSNVPSGRNAIFVGKETSWRNGSGVAPAGTFTSMSRAVKANKTARRTFRRYREMTRCMRVRAERKRMFSIDHIVLAASDLDGPASGCIATATTP